MPRAVQALDDEALKRRVDALAGQIRTRRKALGVTATAAAEAAGISRVTWHRIEKGETSVTVAAWLNALAVLGLEFRVGAGEEAPGRSANQTSTIPVRVRLSRYPQLAALAWQVRDTAELTPREAWEIYRANARHLDEAQLSERERALLQGLETIFGEPDV